MPEPARIVMLQGTGSHAGKTVLVAALCRIYARRGLRVAPHRSCTWQLDGCGETAHGDGAVSADGLVCGT